MNDSNSNSNPNIKTMSSNVYHGQSGSGVRFIPVIGDGKILGIKPITSIKLIIHLRHHTPSAMHRPHQPISRTPKPQLSKPGRFKRCRRTSMKWSSVVHHSKKRKILLI